MSDLRLRYDEPATGIGHPTLPDSVNRLFTADHNNDGTHRFFVDARHFGIVGDNVTDDTAAVQAAIDYAATLPVLTSLRNTATVLVPYGLYKVTSQIVVPSGVNLHCEGILYNNLADAWQPLVWFKAGSHCSKVQLWGNLGSGVKFGEVGTSCDMAIGDVRLWNIGEEYDGVKGSKKGVHFTGYNFTFDSIDCDGGNLGIDIDGASDVRGNKILTWGASTGVRLTSGSEHIYLNSVDIDTPSYKGLQIDSSHDLAIHDCTIFLNDQQLPGGIVNAAVIGEHSGGDKVNNLRIHLSVQDTGGQALKVYNILDSQIFLNVTNAPLGTGNLNLITSGIEFSTGVEATTQISASFGNVATKITGTGGCVTYTEAGALKYRGSAGTITVLGAA
ncbi:MAG: glycoside hydrolase family 55 protein [Nitrospirota bacterium]|nr:glycoside hydrolase family 55 protein [Nitrospirota bacterium]